jgi:hypothetical protein
MTRCGTQEWHLERNDNGNGNSNGNGNGNSNNRMQVYRQNAAV